MAGPRGSSAWSAWRSSSVSGGLPRALAGTRQRWGCRWLQGSGAGWTGGARGGHGWVGEKKLSPRDLVRQSCHFNKSPMGSQEATLTLGTGIRLWKRDGTVARSLFRWFFLFRILNPHLPQALSPPHWVFLRKAVPLLGFQ